MTESASRFEQVQNEIKARAVVNVVSCTHNLIRLLTERNRYAEALNRNESYSQNELCTHAIEMINFKITEVLSIPTNPKTE